MAGERRETTLVRYFLSDWLYIYVRPDGYFFLPEEGVSYDLRSNLPRREQVVIDEFHRAPSPR